MVLALVVATGATLALLGMVYAMSLRHDLHAVPRQLPITPGKAVTSSG
jgi:hypothetical protein